MKALAEHCLGFFSLSRKVYCCEMSRTDPPLDMKKSKYRRNVPNGASVHHWDYVRQTNNRGNTQMIKLFNGNSKELEAIKKLNGKVTRTEPTQETIAKYGKQYNQLIETVGGVA